MYNKVKHIVNTSVFIGIIAAFAIWCAIVLFNPNTEKLEGENRLPAQLPENVTWTQLLNNKTETDAAGNTIQSPIKQFENFTVDQFPLRQFFRYVKAHFTLDILGLNENNGYASEDGSIVQITPSFNQDILDYQIGRLEYVYNTYFKDNGGDHYLALIPDKNYYFGEDYGYPMPDYDALIEQLKGSLSDMEYIDLFGSLELEDYYKTDWHWDQSKLDGVLDTLGDAMGFGELLSDFNSYTQNKLPFSGGYTQQSALYPSGENLTYLTNDILNSCTVYNYLTNKTQGLYDMEKYEEGDPQYAFFLSDGAPLQRIDNPNAKTDKKLMIFRDSYGSSILPLLAEGYSSIYVVDIRYVNPDFFLASAKLTSEDVKDMDILFLYSTTILNTHCFMKEIGTKP